ncbi:ribosomal-protein-alanine acetyltransferase [Gloeomargarita lithophora Alchichica-D10]|uniref:[Ribosomal protein bS18]-alanine N-acetyltransferase n=1 Tax=Gloeomargarita lithophora Alchichica-D10 TaxID=1188229 RepID=A0A1J0AEL8_9CYAN|nr:ribosomal protein S18-alanine N-acetyltransferase [Gloeomargarita lithophora]APB34380.1 ribosomal-protein-alanine acetyltransferase [Gloeomargarita lithophora Alchichica-D10]
MILRRLTVEDLAAVLALDHLALKGWWSPGQYQEELQKSHTLFVGGEQGATLVSMGAAWLILDETHIVLLAVHPQYRGKGWGRLTLNYLLQTAPPTMRHTTLEVRSQNAIALNLYQSLGFQILGRRPHYYQKPEDDALILWRHQEPTLGGD